MIGRRACLSFARRNSCRYDGQAWRFVSFIFNGPKTRSGRVFGPLKKKGTKSFRSDCFPPDENLIVSGSDDQTLMIVSGSIVTGPFRGHTDKVSAAIFSRREAYTAGITRANNQSLGHAHWPARECPVRWTSSRLFRFIIARRRTC